MDEYLALTPVEAQRVYNVLLRNPDRSLDLEAKIERCVPHGGKVCVSAQQKSEILSIVVAG